MPHSRTHSTSNAISIPAIRSALSEAKRFRVGGRQLRPELERALRLLVRPAPSSRDNPADIADRDMGVAVGWSANHCCTYSLQLRGQLAAGRPDSVRHLRFLPRALGESFRADDRGRFAQATPQALRECQKSCAPGRLGAIVHAHAGARCKDREPQRHMTASRQEPTARVRQRIFSAASASVPERRALGLG
jgi:hypothetical protein